MYCKVLRFCLYLHVKYSNFTSMNIENTYQSVATGEDGMGGLLCGVWSQIREESCGDYIWRGQYDNGDRSIFYLDTYNSACPAVFQIYRKKAVALKTCCLKYIVCVAGLGLCMP